MPHSRLARLARRLGEVPWRPHPRSEREQVAVRGGGDAAGGQTQLHWLNFAAFLSPPGPVRDAHLAQHQCW